MMASHWLVFVLAAVISVCAPHVVDDAASRTTRGFALFMMVDCAVFMVAALLVKT